MVKKIDKRILGIDPGTNIMGFGVIEIKGKKTMALDWGIHKMGSKKDHMLKIKSIFEFTRYLGEKYQPDEFAIEAPFYGKNVQSMLKLGRAQGVAMAAALSLEIPITEYAPRKVKQSITGKGGASKEMVAGMIQQLLNIKEIPKDLDATDGLAVALCHHFNANTLQTSRSYSSWSSFVKQNPDKTS